MYIIDALFFVCFLLFLCIITFIYFFKFILFLTLQYCIGFAIYQNESITGIHGFPILNPPPSPYHPSGSSQCTSPKHLWYIYTMEYYSAIKKNTFESVLVRWMKLEPNIFSFNLFPEFQISKSSCPLDTFTWCLTHNSKLNLPAQPSLFASQNIVSMLVKLLKLKI